MRTGGARSRWGALAAFARRTVADSHLCKEGPFGAKQHQSSLIRSCLWPEDWNGMSYEGVCGCVPPSQRGEFMGFGPKALFMARCRGKHAWGVRSLWFAVNAMSIEGFGFPKPKAKP